MMKRTKVEKNRILEKYYVSFTAKRQAALKKVINKELDQIDPEDHRRALRRWIAEDCGSRVT